MYYPEEVVEEVRARNDIVDVISSYVGLKRAGSNYTCCCPFHNEKTPSFSVSRQKQMFYCFGCHEGGNVISFIMKYEHFTFPEALKSLADRVGYVLPDVEPSEEEKNRANRKQQLRDVNTAAAAHYHYLLTKTEQMVKDVEESGYRLLCRSPLLYIVDDEHVNGLVEIDKVIDCILAAGICKLHLEQACRYIEHTLARIHFLTTHANGINQMRLATT